PPGRGPGGGARCDDGRRGGSSAKAASLNQEVNRSNWEPVSRSGPLDRAPSRRWRVAGAGSPKTDATRRAFIRSQRQARNSPRNPLATGGTSALPSRSLIPGVGRAGMWIVSSASSIVPPLRLLEPWGKDRGGESPNRRRETGRRTG